MPKDEIDIEILDDGVISVNTDAISGGEIHLQAEQFLKEVSEGLGQDFKVTKRDHTLMRMAMCISVGIRTTDHAGPTDHYPRLLDAASRAARVSRSLPAKAAAKNARPDGE